MAERMQLVVRSEGLSEQTRNELAAELNRWIRQNIPEVQVEAARGTAKPGQKGAEVLAGALTLFVTSGVAKTLVECIATWIKERRRSVKLELTDAGGARVSLAADNLGRAEIDRLVTQLSDMKGPTPPRSSQPPAAPPS